MNPASQASGSSHLAADAGLAETLSWPFFDDAHREFAARLSQWAAATLPSVGNG